MENQLRILVVLPMYGGSLPVGRYCVTALEELGHSVRLFEAPVFYPTFSALRHLDLSPEQITQLENGFLSHVSEAVWAHVKAFEPHLVLCLAQAPMSRMLLQRIRRTGIRTCMWFVEDYTIFQYWKLYAPLYDVFCVIQKEPFLTELRSLGQNNALYLPMACQPSFHRHATLTPEEQRTYGADIAFLGAGYPNRRLAFRPLAGRNFKIWGSDWDGETALADVIQRNGERIHEEEAVRIYSASTVNINLHSSVKTDSLISHGDFVNPRTFELASIQAFQIVDERTLLPELFSADEIATFSSVREMYSCIDFFLHHPEERASYVEKACTRALRDHTYAIRMQTLLSYIQDNLGFPAFERDAASGESQYAEEISQLLMQLNAGPNASFDDVISRLRKRQGRLTELETGLLFLSEFQNQYRGKETKD